MSEFKIKGGGANQVNIDNGGTVVDGSFLANAIEKIRFNGVNLKTLLDNYVQYSSIFKARIQQICEEYCKKYYNA